MSTTKTKASKQESGARVITFGKRNISFSKEEQVCGVLLIVLILLVIAIRSNFSGIPFERDEGIYAYNGLKVLEGKTPYIDFYEQKFPGIFYFYALMVSVVGQSVEALHMGWTVLNVLTIVILYFASKLLFSPVPALITSITFAFASLIPNLSGFTIQSEHAVALFISTGLLFYALQYRTGNKLYYFLMGLAFGLGFMTKTSGMFLVLWGGIITIFDSLFMKKPFKILVRDVLIYSGGVFLVIGCFFLAIIVQGAWQQMLYWTIEIPSKYVGKMPFEEGKKYFKYTLDAIVANHKYLFIHAALSLLLLLFKNISLRTKVFGITFAFFSFMTIVPGYYFYGHYWMMLVPGLAVISGLTCWGILMLLIEKFNVKSPNLKYIYLGVFIVITLMHLSKMKSYYFHPNYELIMRQVYGNNPFPETMEIANFINGKVKPEDQIVVIGSEPQMYIYTKKPCPSRHAYFAALVDDNPHHGEWQREFIRDVEAAKPKYFVFYRHGISLFVQPNTDSHIFDWVNKYATEHYKVVGIVDMVDGQRSNYVWNQDVNTYQPVSQNVIYIFERTT